MKCHQLFSSNFDMLAANGSPPLLEPIHYINENSFKIVKNSRTKKSKLPTQKFATKKTISKKGKTGVVEKKAAVIENIIKTELNTSCNEDEILKVTTADPLFTPQVLIKYELDVDNFETDVTKCEEEEEESDILFNSDNDDKDFYVDVDYEEEQPKMERKKKICRKRAENNEFDVDDEDEPLIGLKEKSGARKTGKRTKNPRFKDCKETCKHKCTNKFEIQQRLDIYHFYWQLNQENKINFLRTHVRKPVVRYLQKNTLRCCYFIKIYKSSDIVCSKQSGAIQNGINFSPDDEELTKVCRKFFTGTLKISDQEIKEAIKDFVLIPERIKHVTKDTPKLPKIQYLDPETGDLSETKPKKPKRRKNKEPPPKRLPKPVKCAISCKFKCHEKFSEDERKQICDVFWSLDYQRRKDFVLSRLEIRDVKRRLNPEYRKTNGPTRAYQTKYYLRLGPKTENVRVCKHFMENTLNVHKCFIENAIEFSDKTTGAYTGFDRRAQNNKINVDRLQAVVDHIGSYPFWLPNKKCKTKYLHHSLTIRKMYEAYKEKCLAKNMDIVSVNFYYKIFHKDFRILFLANPHSEKGRGYFKSNPNISHYTGDESGGCWYNRTGALLDLHLTNSPITAGANQNITRISCLPKDWDTFSSRSNATLALNLVQNPLKSFTNQNSSAHSTAAGSVHLSADSEQMPE